jgi:hypothetical protein
VEEDPGRSWFRQLAEALTSTAWGFGTLPHPGPLPPDAGPASVADEET